MSEPGSSEEEIAELRRCLRDVLGLLGLPAVWRTRGEEEILSTFADALATMPDVDVVTATARSREAVRSVVRVHGASAPERLDQATTWFSALGTRGTSNVGTVACAELGSLRALYEPIGYRAAQGKVVVASRRADFPSESELVVIRAATALATTSLDGARVTAEREEAIRAKDDFLAVLGHELRNPLAPIVTALDLIRQRDGGNLLREETIIARQVDHLGRLVDDLLDVARIVRGNFELKPSIVDLGDILRQAVETTASLRKARRQTVRVDVSEPAIRVEGDAFRLNQILVNVLTNAARYSPEGGHVDVSVSVRGDRAVLSVRDDGVGMSAELLPRIFEPFVQGHRSAGVQYGGLGVGLALVRRLVTLHGGSVTARSEGPGRGSRFDIELPRAAATAEIAPEGPVDGEEVGARSARRRRVLVVDDNVDAGELLVIALTAAGHDARVIHDPLVAASVAQDFAAEIVILDIGMPLLDGYGVAANIRKRLGADAPSLIALTGYGQASDRERSAMAGFAEHFVKPVDLASLMVRIAAL